MEATGEVTYKVFWTLAESQIRQAQSIYRGTISSAADNKEWKKHIISGLSCLYGLLRLCTTPRDQPKYFGTDLVLGADTESKTRLRIAQILGDWAQGKEEEEERQLSRALMSLPGGDIYIDTRYTVVAAQCRLFMRRGEVIWAEQKLKSSLNDAQQRGQHRWVQHFGLDLARLYLDKGDERSANNVLQTLTGYMQRVGDKMGLAVALVQQLGIAVHARNWAVVDPLLASLDSLAGDPGVPQIWTRFWVLKAGSMHSRGRVTEAQEACDRARHVLMEWQGFFARQLAANLGSSSGSFGGIRGWSYYEAHAWVMLMSSFVQDHEPALRFLNLALEGVARGEADGERGLGPLKLHIYLRMADVSIAAQSMADAKHAIDQALAVGGSFWRKSRDAIALRWAMYLHRTGHSLEAMDAYRCVISGPHEDLRFAAQVNLAVLQILEPTTQVNMRSTVAELIQAVEALPNGPHECVRRSLLELVQGIETEEPVKAKTHLLACLKMCSDTADSVLQGWTLCLLGTLVLPAGQYEQAMRMCAAGQNIAQSANDPLQKAAAIGILSHIEHAVGDPERRAKLLEIDQQCLEQFNARIQE